MRKTRCAPPTCPHGPDDQAGAPSLPCLPSLYPFTTWVGLDNPRLAGHSWGVPAAAYLWGNHNFSYTQPVSTVLRLTKCALFLRHWCSKRYNILYHVPCPPLHEGTWGFIATDEEVRAVAGCELCCQQFYEPRANYFIYLSLSFHFCEMSVTATL